MTTAPTTTQQATGDHTFEAFSAAMAESDAPLLGHLVLYSIFASTITVNDLETWFTELGLDPGFLPSPLRNVDAFERITGPDGVKVTYPLSDPTATGPASRRGERRRSAPADRIANLMIRPVRRDGAKIVRHVVREIRDEKATKLSYDTHIAEVTFLRNHDSPDEGDGTLDVAPDNTAINALPAAEAETVRAMLTDITAAYDGACSYLSADRLRTLVRSYIERLGAIRVRPTGGVYFVYHRHADTLASLRELVSRCGDGSHLVRIPIPDQGEMREMITTAFATKAKTDLEKLAADIAAASRGGASTAKTERLYARFSELAKTTSQHSELLSTSLDDTTAALSLVKTQLGSLLTAGTDDEDDSDDQDDDTNSPSNTA